MTVPELRNLLEDCLDLWSVTAWIEADRDGIILHAGDGAYRIHPAPEAQHPARWFYQTPERAAANRPPRAAPSIVALLSALRNALGAEGGSRLRVGAP